MKPYLLIIALSLLSIASMAQRSEVNLSGNDWQITLDKNANWQHDTLYVHPILGALSVNEPTGGWSLLNHPDKSGVRLPATVEGELWGWNGTSYGVTGNYVGVSWWHTTASVPQSWRGRRVCLDFSSVRFRAEVFVNHHLAGYDLVNSTSFEVDVTHYVKYGESNDIDIRITDPNGNFNWKDSQCFSWGNYLVNPSHGFGGLSGYVSLVATPQDYISDVFIENTPEPRTVKVHIEGASRPPYKLEIREHGKEQIIWSSTVTSQDAEVFLPEAKLWSVDAPNLYDLTVRTATDEVRKHFGFRWFEVRSENGDRQFYLNGKRMVLITAISWSFWPGNGITPSKELAVKQVEDAKRLGMNMLNFHRCIGNTDVLNAADSLGLLYFEEPGGNQYPIGKFYDGSPYTQFYFDYRNEKLARMIRRDRSHPSLVIYNLHNERGANPQEEDRREMRLAQQLDPSRIITYNSCNGKNPEGEPNDHFKLHLLPGDTTFHNMGWWDNHHAGGPGVYHDALYKGVNDYLRYSNNREEIVYWGEEGAIGTPPRLQLIRDELLRTGHTSGWEARDYLDWYDAYDSFLKNRGFSKAFPCVDSLTRKMGNVAYYYQGRIMENVHISNTVDAYAVNGWESMKLENHSGIVDVYRNLKGDPDLIARYNRPLYLAVKLNHKVLPVGDTTVVDVYIVNEKNIHGKATLKVSAFDAAGEQTASKSYDVTVRGGTVYGQNLSKGLQVTATGKGYGKVKATLYQHGKPVAEGSDEFYAVDVNADGISGKILVNDTSGMLQGFLKSEGIGSETYKNGIPDGDLMIVGAAEPKQFGSGMNDILEWVTKGHTLIVVDNAERWADLLCDKEMMDYRGSKALGKSWYGGNYFCRNHPIFKGLPTDCVFNWEYQCFAAYNRHRVGLRDMSGDIIVGCVSDHRKEVYSALSEIKVGRGTILITTLDIPSCLKGMERYAKAVDIDGMNEAMNTFNNEGRNKANVVGVQLLLNMLRYAISLVEK